MTTRTSHILVVAAASLFAATASYGAADPLETAVRACISERSETVDWKAVLGDWTSVRLSKSPSDGFAWALTMDDLVALDNRDRAGEINERAQEHLSRNRGTLRSDFRDDFWERFEHSSGWQLGIFYNPAGHSQCYMWNAADRLDDFAFMRGEVTGDLLWDTFVSTPVPSDLWRSFSASFGAGPQAGLASVSFTGMVLMPDALEGAPRSFLMVKTYHAEDV